MEVNTNENKYEFEFINTLEKLVIEDDFIAKYKKTVIRYKKNIKGQ